MGTLNPDVGPISAPNMPDQTNASRGAIPDRSLGVIAEGLGQAAKIGVDMYNTYNHDAIDKSVRSGFDQANKPYLDTIPGELNGSITSMQQLQTAYEQGKISDVYYTGQLAAMSKKLRAQYPLYEDYVDNKIQDITGIRPANAYINAVQAEFAKAESNKQQESNKWDTFVNQHGDSITNTLPDYWANPTKYSQDEVKAAVFGYEAKMTTMQHENLANALLDHDNKLSVDAAKEGATKSLNQTVGSYLKSFGDTTLGFNPQDLLKNIQKYGAEGGSPEQAAQIASQLNLLKSSVYSKLLTQANTPLNPDDATSRSYAQILGPDELKKQIELAMAPIDNMIDMANNKDFGSLSYYARLNQVSQDTVMNTVLNASPELATAYALKNISPDLANLYLNEAGKTNDIFSQLAPEVVARIANGQDTFYDATERMMKARVDAGTKSGGINALIDANKQTIVSGLATPDQFANAVINTYGLDKEKKTIFSYIKSGEYSDLWKNMYSPDVTQAIIKSGDPKLMELYARSALDTAKGIPALAVAAGDINNRSVYSPAAKVEWNPDFNQLVLTIDPTKINQPTGGGFAGRMAQDAQNGAEIKRATDAVNNINAVFSQVGAILDAENAKPEDKTAILSQFLKDINVQTGNATGKGLLDVLAEGMGNVSNAAVSSVNWNNILTDFNFTPLDQLQNTYNTEVTNSYMGKVRGAESGGNDNAANPNSSATGRYQIIDSTYNRYAKKLGLTGDKNDPANQEAVMQAYTRDSQYYLSVNNLPATDGNLYLLHFLGQDAGTMVLRQDPSTPLDDVLPQRVINANGFLKGMTVGDIINWANKKMK